MAFNFPRPKFLSTLSLVGGLLLMFGLGLTVFSTQQQQDNRSRAAFSRPSTPSSIQTEKSSQTSLGPCWEPAGGGERAGAMCESDGGTQNGSVSDSQARSVCPGGFVGGNARNGATSSSTWYCPGGNEYRCCKNAKPSISQASANKTTITVGESITLSGSATDPDATSLHKNQYGSDEKWRSYITYRWTRVSGPTSPSLPAEGTSANATVTGLQAGTYVFRLTASDGFATATKDITVIVNAPSNNAPTANAGADKEITLPTNSVTLAGSGNDSDGTITKYEWTKTSGPTAGTITSPASASTTVTGLVEGIYKFTLKVTDNDNATHTDEVQVKVNASTQTSFSFELLLHGIGKGGDNSNPTGVGTLDPETDPRPILVEVREDSNGPVITSKTGQLTFNSGPGNYTGTVDMGTALTASKSYVITVISKSLRGSITKGITVGTSNTIAFTLVNGDADQNGKLNILDYTMIEGCLVDPDFSPVPKDCDAERAAKADLDDDGTVLIFDLTLFLREIRVQPL